MIGENRDDGLSVRYLHDDEDRRQDFGRKLAGYVRGHRDRWNIATFLGVLDLLGRDVSEIRLTLLRRAGGRLAVTIDYELTPIGAAVSHDVAPVNSRRPP